MKKNRTQFDIQRTGDLSLSVLAVLLAVGLALPAFAQDSSEVEYDEVQYDEVEYDAAGYDDYDEVEYDAEDYDQVDYDTSNYDSVDYDEQAYEEGAVDDLPSETVVDTDDLSADNSDDIAEAQEQYDQDYGSSSDIDEVVVTVERRATSLQDYAGTAVSFTQEEMKLQGVQNITDLSESVVGLEVGNTRGNVSVWIRGVGSDNVTELGDPAAAMHIDGIYIPRPRGIGGAFFDLERVEVNIGPQGTLRGRNAMAGSINAISWNPGLGQWNAAVEAEFGNFGSEFYTAVLNAPVTEKSAIRLALLKRDGEPYYNDVSPDNRTGPEATNDFAGRLKFLYEPTDRLSLLFAADLLTERGTGYTGTNFANPLGNGIPADSIADPRDVYLRGITPIQDTKHWGGKFELNYDFDDLTLQFLYGYRNLLYNYQASTPLTPDYPGVIDSLGGPNVREALDDFSRFQDVTDSVSDIVELRLFTDPENYFYYSTGLFYFNERQYSFLGATGDGGTFFNGIEFNQPDTDTESIAAYFDGTFNLSERSRATFGFRFTSESKSRRGVNASYRVTGFGVNAAGNQFSPGLGFRFGTEGFEFAIRDRTIFDPDTNGDGLTSQTEYFNFILDGVKRFGNRDNFDEALNNTIAGLDTPCIDTRLDDDLFCPGSGTFTRLPDDSTPDDPTDSVPGIIAFSPLTSVTPQFGQIDSAFFDWRLRYEYDFTDDNLAYFLIATGHKSGLFNDTFTQPLFEDPSNPGTLVPTSDEGQATAVRRINGVGSLDTETDPERVTNYELGTKNEFDLGGEVAARLNATLFYQNYTKQIFCNVLSVQSILSNAGTTGTQNTTTLGVNFCFNAKKSEIFGSQIESALFLPKEITLKLNALWLESYFRNGPVLIQDSRFQQDINPEGAVEVDIAGNRLPRSPRFSFNLSLSQSIDTAIGSIDWLLSAAWRDDQFMSVFNGIDYRDTPDPDDPSERLDDSVAAYWTYDAGFGLNIADTNFRLEAFINNITNEIRPAAIIITQTDNTRFFTRPRTFGLRAKWQL